MRKNYIVSSLLLMLLMAALYSCKEQSADAEHAAHMQEYTCPMHPQIIKKQPGKCPICGMDLVLKDSNNELTIDSSLVSLSKPVNEQAISTIPTLFPQKGTRIYTTQVSGVVTYDSRNQTSISSRVSGRIERLPIKYNFQPVKKGQLIMEIYSPDLAAAQRELLFIAGTGNSEGMLSKARQRLLLLGMYPAQIEHVLKTQKILYSIPVYSNNSGYILEQGAASSTSVPSAMNSPAAKSDGMNDMGGAISNTLAKPATNAPSSSPVLLREGQYVSAGQPLFTIYSGESLVAEFALQPQFTGKVKRGQKLLFYPTTDKDNMSAATIGLIEPVFRNGQNFTLARVYLNNRPLQAGQLLTGNIPVIYEQGWWVPKKALLRLGNKAVVFKKENNVYLPMEVQAGC